MNRQETRRLNHLCVFCGAATGTDPAHGAAAARLGVLLARAGVTLVFGGGRRGLMGVLAESVLTEGGRVVGIIPEHLIRPEVAYHEVSELIVVDSMHTRKRRMFDMADAFCVLPGGMGTLDEAFEILTWKQLGLHDRPVVLANWRGFWSPLLGLVDHLVAGGFVSSQAAAESFTVVDDVESILPAIEAELGVGTTIRTRVG